MNLHGCDVQPITDSLAVIQAILESKQPTNASYSWLLAHCDDGILWGKWDSGWKLATSAFNFCPTLQRDGSNVQQLRLFGDDEELLLWRTSDGLKGRVLKDSQIPTDESLKPSVEKVIVMGNKVEESVGDFSRVTDLSGRWQILPWSISKANERYPLRLVIKHYYEKDDCTGAVRIAGSRLVQLKEVNSGTR